MGPDQYDQDLHCLQFHLCSSESTPNNKNNLCHFSWIIVIALSVPIFRILQYKRFVIVVVSLLFYVHGKHLRSCRDGQLT